MFWKQKKNKYKYIPVLGDDMEKLPNVVFEIRHHESCSELNVFSGLW